MTPSLDINALNEGGNTFTDFAANEIIQVKVSTFSGGLVTDRAITADQFHLGAIAQDRNDRVIFNAATRQLFFDVDDNGGTAQVCPRLQPMLD